MCEKYLIINAGSSSLKFSLYDMPKHTELVNGVFEKIGAEDSFYTLKFNGQKKETKKVILNHSDAVKCMLSELLENDFIDSIDDIKGVGHRIVHGGEKYRGSAIIDEEVLNDIKEYTKFAPLHHPGQIAGIEAMMKCLNDVPMVAVFDTAFHQTMPKENYLYAVPYEWYEKYGVRKYGFHGTSHRYITETMKILLGKNNINIISAHLGNGSSISIIKNGECFDTTMGMTPLAGLPMGTRAGDIDSSMIEYMCEVENLSLNQVMNILNSESGLKGICGKSDFRDVQGLAAIGDEKAILAINKLKDSIVGFIGQYHTKLCAHMDEEAKVDAIVFTAGIGENVSVLREIVLKDLSKSLGIKLDKEANDSIAGFKEKNNGKITTNDSKIPVYVIPTDEEFMILDDTYTLCSIEYINRERECNKVKVLK